MSLRKSPYLYEWVDLLQTFWLELSEWSLVLTLCTQPERNEPLILPNKGWSVSLHNGGHVARLDGDLLERG